MSPLAFIVLVCVLAAVALAAQGVWRAARAIRGVAVYVPRHRADADVDGLAIELAEFNWAKQMRPGRIDRVDAVAVAYAVLTDTRRRGAS